MILNKELRKIALFFLNSLHCAGIEENNECRVAAWNKENS